MLFLCCICFCCFSFAMSSAPKKWRRKRVSKSVCCPEKCPFVGGKAASPQKTGPGSQRLPRHSAEPLGFCRKVLQNVSHSKKLVDERFCRTPKVLQNFGSQAQLFRPCKFFSHFSPKKCLFLQSNFFVRPIGRLFW